MGYLGTWQIDDELVFPANTHTPSTGAATDADGAPSYRVYELETTTPILTGTMALLDGSNTVGLYSEAITLSAANGFEVGKCYTIYVSATVGGITGTLAHTFQVELAPATLAGVLTANAIADAVLGRAVSNVQDTADTTSLAAIILAILESSVVGTVWTIRKTGGTTFVTKTLTVDPSANPVTGVT